MVLTSIIKDVRCVLRYIITIEVPIQLRNCNLLSALQIYNDRSLLESILIVKLILHLRHLLLCHQFGHIVKDLLCTVFIVDVVLGSMSCGHIHGTGNTLVQDLHIPPI